MKPILLAACLALPAAAHAEDKVSIALDWTLNTNHIGLIVARDQGLYKDAGLEVDILPYTDSTSTALLAAKVTEFAYMTSLGFLSARAAEADITALWATMQHETGRLVYNSANTAITRPADLTGKIYAGFGSAWEGALISTMIETDGGEPTYDTVTLGTGAYEALANGAVDFTLEVSTWEGVNSVLLGREQSSFAYTDYGVPDQQNGYIGTTTEILADRPDMVARFMKATQAGYAWAADNPAAAADMLIAAGDFPNGELVQGSMQAIADGGFLRDGDTPVGTINMTTFGTMAKFLFDSGVLKGPGGTALEWTGDIESWVDQSWMAH
ncbi:ABC transporter substrate-binding protein [Marinovum sp. 2_MG-2023]|uniref:ABC transporter substrate-binding protein n=1 Tax=unclassified Marinovum TaxID=2647166 RepID=UPI0026E40961|nr:MULTISPECIES: ABC transporter substrate-binding protein [unclassified Marinovum]MDO6731475.1 ABC transporter substrate-binding protein [Marinovum sp. 2_MG-2023]MDO6780835.1 ABC transporter substrate-binding protein [Marinovum sp. 1_MG-2023]